MPATNPSFDLPHVLADARAAVVWNGSAYPEPPNKRRAGGFIQRVRSVDALAELRLSLVTLPNHDDVAMMTWPTITFEFLDENEQRLIVVGYIHAGWVRCEQLSDQPLADPFAMEHWLDRWIQSNRRT